MADPIPLRRAEGDSALQSPARVALAAVFALAVWPLLGLSWEPASVGAPPPTPAPIVATDAGAAARIAAELTGGRVLDVQTRFDDGQEYYSVKVLLTDGHVKVVELEAPAPVSAPTPEEAEAAADAEAAALGAVRDDAAAGTISDTDTSTPPPPPPDTQDHEH